MIHLLKEVTPEKMKAGVLCACFGRKRDYTHRKLSVNGAKKAEGPIFGVVFKKIKAFLSFSSLLFIFEEFHQRYTNHDFKDHLVLQSEQ